MTLDRILRRPEVLLVTGLSSASLYRFISEGSFPRPLQLGRNSVGWKASVVQAWIDSLAEAGGSDGAAAADRASVTCKNSPPRGRGRTGRAGR